VNLREYWVLYAIVIAIVNIKFLKRQSEAMRTRARDQLIIYEPCMAEQSERYPNGIWVRW